MKVYQLVSYLNGYNKRKKQWENLHSVTIVAVGKAGLKTLCKEFEAEKSRQEYERSCNNWRKYSEVRGKVELQEPHVHENGKLAYWGDKIIQSYNPDSI
jgi:hypothetical protein